MGSVVGAAARGSAAAGNTVAVEDAANPEPAPVDAAVDIDDDGT